MAELASAPAFLLIGNDATEQNPLVAWQIRTAIRQHGSRLYIVDSQEPGLKKRAKQFVKVAPGQEGAFLAALVGDGAAANAPTSTDFQTLRDALSGENDLVVLFGAAIQGPVLNRLAAFAASRAAEGKRTRFVALSDAANSRGAADMGLLPDRLPGYASVRNEEARAMFGGLWGARLPEKPGLDAPAMLAAAMSGKLKALYVVGANPAKSLQLSASQRLGKLDLLIVQDMFLTETARLADIVLPVLSAYEKNGTVTNCTGEVQMVRKGGDFTGARSDFDILRILSHQLAGHGLGQPIRLRTPDAAFEEIRRAVPGYNVSWHKLEAGAAEAVHSLAEIVDPADVSVPTGAIFSADDTLFTSGSLTPYCSMMRSLREVEERP